MKHLDFEKLVNNFEGSLAPAELQTISKHIRDCRHCAAEAKKLEKFFSYVQFERIAKVPQATTARLLNIFEPRKFPAGSKKGSRGRHLLASLVFDDWQTAVHERLAAAETRQMLFQADKFQIDLRFQFLDGKCRFSGQIFPDCRHPATAAIFSSATSELVSLNDYCEFVFPLLPEGIYKFQLNLGGEIVEIENLSLVG